MDRQNNGNLSFTLIFWLVLFLLFVLQAIYTFGSTGQIRYEELAESVRNVFWLEQRTIYDGTSSNVGWYATLLVLYKLLGFSLNLTKIYRLVLFIFSITALALILKKYLGIKKSLIPVLTIGLSPVFLFFNTLQTSYATDVQYLMICIYLLDDLDFAKKTKSYLTQFGLGFITMLASMSYPSFIFYLPALVIVYILKLNFKKNSYTFLAKNISVAVLSFLLPLLTAIVYVKNRSLLIYDPIANSSMFRGGGSFHFDINLFWFNTTHLFHDLFIKPNSYHFDIYSTEFSGYYPFLPVITVIGAGAWLTIKTTRYQKWLTMIWLTLFFNLLVANFTQDASGMPGIRRYTALLASFYALYVVVWHYINTIESKQLLLKWSLIFILLLMPLHHVQSYLANYSHLSSPSIYRYEQIFGLLETPDKSLQYCIKLAVQDNLKLTCSERVGCGYAESYAAVTGACLWNKINCKPIYGYDFRSGKYIPLETKLWENYYLEH